MDKSTQCQNKALVWGVGGGGGAKSGHELTLANGNAGFN